jgi:hypothetical protein
MLITIIPLLVALVGLLMYALAANPKLGEVGRLLFFVGALVTVSVVSRGTVRLL